MESVGDVLTQSFVRRCLLIKGQFGLGLLAITALMQIRRPLTLMG